MGGFVGQKGQSRLNCGGDCRSVRFVLNLSFISWMMLSIFHNGNNIRLESTLQLYPHGSGFISNCFLA